MPPPSLAPRRVRAAALGLLLAACCLPLAACGGDSGGSSTADAALSVTVSPPEATAGSTVKASVVNDTDKQFTYGLAYELERQGDNGFEKVHLPNRAIQMIGLIAEPGGTGPPVEVQLPKNLAPGTYRVVIQRNVPDVGDLSGQFEIVSG